MSEMPQIKRFYENIPKEWKARKAKGSPNFAKTLSVEYLVKENRRVFAEGSIDKQNERIELNLYDKNRNSLGSFSARRMHGGIWEIPNRFVDYHHRRLNLGKICFRLMELQIRKMKGEEIFVKTDQRPVIITILGLGWKVDANSGGGFKSALGLRKSDRLPDAKAIKEILLLKKDEELPESMRFRRDLRLKATNQP